MIKEKIQMFPIMSTLACLCTFIAQLFGLTKISSLSFYCCCIISLCNFVYLCVFNEIKCKEFIPILAIALTGIVGIALKTQGDVGLSYLNSYIFLIIVFISIYNNLNLKINDKTLQCILYLVISVSLIFIGMFFLNKDNLYWYLNSEYLTFRLSNPNLAGLFLLFLLLYNFIGIYKNKNFLKILCIIISLFLLYFILETKARSCLLTLCFFIVVLLMFIKQKIKNWMIFLGLLIPLIFVVIYMQLIESNLNLGFLNFLVDKGKDLDSRYEIWNETLSVIKDNFLFGNYFEISDGSGNFQRHNIWLHILSGFGVITFVVAYLYFYFALKSTNQTNIKNDILGRIAIICFMTIIVQGIFEATIFSGALGLFVLFTQFLSIGNGKINYVKKQYE